MLQHVPTPRLSGGRKPRRPVPVSQDVTTLIQIARERSPQDVAYWLYRYVGSKVDDELEALATHFLAEDFLDIAQGPEVQALLSKGRSLEAITVAMSRLRRRTSKVLRDHQRSEDDAFLDSCVQE